MARKILIVEGDDTIPNEALLRHGFEILLKKIIRGRPPRIKAGGGKSPCINRFKKAQRQGKDTPCLLIDLDAPPAHRETDLHDYDLTKHRMVVFYMIHEMESWFISQPQMLNDYYGIKGKGRAVSEKLPKRPYHDIPEPDKALMAATKDSHTGIYHKIRHGVELLERLDARALYEADDDFKRLVDFINA